MNTNHEKIEDINDTNLCEHSFIDSDNEGEYGKEHCRFCEFEQNKE